jgi:uncharacterized peroxidase-related enzyme
MRDFTVHTEQSAPAGARPVLSAVRQQLGFLPNLLGVMAESPAAVEAYATLARLFDSTSLTAAERHVVLQSVNLANQCHYCVPAHSALAGLAGLGEVDRALRSGAPLGDARLESLRAFTHALVSKRGAPSEADLAAFERAGYGHAAMLDVLLGVAMKTLSNYVNHVAHTPIDAMFLGRAA